MIGVKSESYLKSTSLLEIARSLNSNLSPSELVSQFVKQLSQLMQVEQAFFILKEDDELFYQYLFKAYQINKPFTVKLLPSDHPYRKLMANDEKIEDIEAFHGEYYINFIDYFEKENIVFSLPLIANGELLGILNLGPKLTRIDYTRKDIELLELVVLQAATAIGNSLAYTRLQKAYEDLKMAQEELVQAEKLSAIGQIASAIVHDFRSPMAAIQGYAELIGDCSGDREIERYSEKIVENVQRLNGMARELLDFARADKPGSYKKEPCDISYIIHESLYAVEKIFERNNIHFVEVNGLENALRIDKHRMVRVFTNLFRNAAEAMPDGGMLKIEINQKDDDVVIEVSDTGAGIPEEIQETLFEPFVTYGKPSGTGLGMTITKQIVEAHRGEIQFDTTLDEGTTFVITLPAT